MTTHAHLVLADGTVYRGQIFGESNPVMGEVVFNTSMTGYQEMLTDPSYAGQIVMPTYPLIGNYGINLDDNESSRIQVAGFIVREHSLQPSHYNSIFTLEEYLKEQGITGISNLDTRAVTRRIRSTGVMMGIITTEDPAEALGRLKVANSYDSMDLVQSVSTQESYEWESSGASKRIIVMDFGVKYNILRSLSKRGCAIRILPPTATAEEIMSFHPDGVLFSPGPGDPMHNQIAIRTAKNLIGTLPIMGICLGHQIVSIAMGATTYKLKFGHRGGNHPVQDLTTNRIYITAQNHGYAVSDNNLPPELKVTHRNINDETIEGIRHIGLPIMTIQYHSEASPGPLDNDYIFDDFIDMTS